MWSPRGKIKQKKKSLKILPDFSAHKGDVNNSSMFIGPHLTSGFFDGIKKITTQNLLFATIHSIMRSLASSLILFE